MLEDVKIVLRDKLDVNLPLDDDGTTLVGDKPPYPWATCTQYLRC